MRFFFLKVKPTLCNSMFRSLEGQERVKRFYSSYSDILKIKLGKSKYFFLFGCFKNKNKK